MYICNIRYKRKRLVFLGLLISENKTLILHFKKQTEMATLSKIRRVLHKATNSDGPDHQIEANGGKLH